MAINVSINTTPAQEAKLERVRLKRNEEGASFTSVDDMAKKDLVEKLTGLAVWMDDIDAVAAESQYRAAFRNASPEVKAQVKALLGVV